LETNTQSEKLIQHQLSEDPKGLSDLSTLYACRRPVTNFANTFKTTEYLPNHGLKKNSVRRVKYDTTSEAYLFKMPGTSLTKQLPSAYQHPYSNEMKTSVTFPKNKIGRMRN